MSEFDAFVDEVNQSQYGWKSSLVWTYDTTRKLIADGIEGDLVECGVAAGVHPAMMWQACADAGVTRNIRLFDSFQGLPHGSSKDGDDWNSAWGDGSGRLEPTGVAACSLPDVQANLQRWGCDLSMFSFFVGWFQESLPKVAEPWVKARAEGRAEGIAFLRLDGDLHASTLACLQGLWPLMVLGGVLVVDDLNLEGCRQAVTDYFGFMPAFQEITASGDGWLKVEHTTCKPGEGWCAADCVAYPIIYEQFNRASRRASRARD